MAGWWFAALVKRSLLPLQVEELEALYRLLHFPEEVALRLAETEYQLFYQVPPIDYLRQVSLDCDPPGADHRHPSHGHGHSHDHAAGGAAAGGASARTNAAQDRPSVHGLIKRFIEVNSIFTSSNSDSDPAGPRPSLTCELYP